jgi:hypothetical protein
MMGQVIRISSATASCPETQDADIPGKSGEISVIRISTADRPERVDGKLEHNFLSMSNS